MRPPHFSQCGVAYDPTRPPPSARARPTRSPQPRRSVERRAVPLGGPGPVGRGSARSRGRAIEVAGRPRRPAISETRCAPPPMASNNGRSSNRRWKLLEQQPAGFPVEWPQRIEGQAIDLNGHISLDFPRKLPVPGTPPHAVYSSTSTGPSRIGENGSGKSTLLDAIAVAPRYGPRSVMSATSRSSRSPIHHDIAVVRSISTPEARCAAARPATGSAGRSGDSGTPGNGLPSGLTNVISPDAASRTRKPSSCTARW